MNLVLVTSVINSSSESSIFSPNERLDQLINKTIPSINQKIPNPYIVIIEGSDIDSNQKQKLNNISDELLIFPIAKNLQKSIGEVILLLNFLNSNNFFSIINNIDNIIKITGRYYLLDEYNFNQYDGSVIKIDKVDWTNNYVCQTQYYKVSKNKIKQYIEKLNIIKNEGIFIDLEHTFYKYEVVVSDSKIERVGFAGFCGPDGKYIIDGKYVNI
jgi:hypothetical protein